MSVISLGEPGYPKLLSQIKNPPKKLFYKGVWDSSLFEKCLAVVGSRKMTPYGEKITNSLVSCLAEAGVTIISGFMYGIDSVAHASALNSLGKTIAVMPCGIDLVIPAYQQDLYNRIISLGGLIVSEYEGRFPPENWTFFERNRIVAGLSGATLVVEAGKNSGSLITADFSFRFNRKVFAVPGNIDSKVSFGTLDLIEKGAEMVISSEKLLDFYGIPKNFRKENAIKDKGSERILSLLELGPMPLDRLLEEAQEPAQKLIPKLTLLETQGLIKQREGKYYAS